MARQSGAFDRLRGFSSPDVLLRMLLLHVARGYSLRMLATAQSLGSSMSTNGAPMCWSASTLRASSHTPRTADVSPNKRSHSSLLRKRLSKATSEMSVQFASLARTTVSRKDYIKLAKADAPPGAGALHRDEPFRNESLTPLPQAR